MEQSLNDAYNPDDFRRFGHQLIETLSDYLESIQSAEDPNTIQWFSPDRQLSFWKKDFSKPLLKDPDPLFKDILSHSIHLHSRRTMGHQVAPPLPVSVLASFLSSFLNNGLAVYEMGMAGNAIEKVVTEHLAGKFGFDDQSSGLITSGGSLGNLTALLAARASATNVWNDGYSSDQSLAVMVSEEAHYSVDRTLRIMGLGSEGIIKIPVNEKFQMRCDLLKKALKTATAKGKKVCCIIGSACSTATGSYDDLKSIAAFAAKHKLWFHVDGAHGAAAIYSPVYKHLLKGIEQADSVILDFHKMMLTPALCTAVLFKQKINAYKTFAQNAQYLWATQGNDEWYNSGKVTFECTKHINVLSLYTILRLYGEDIFRQNVEVLYGLAADFASLIT